MELNIKDRKGKHTSCILFSGLQAWVVAHEFASLQEEEFAYYEIRIYGLVLPLQA